MKKSLHIGINTLLVLIMFSGLSVLAQKKNSMVDPQYGIGKTATPITIDGTIDAAWNGVATYIAVDPTTWTPKPDLTGMSDCSFKWTALWDDTNLYLLVDITDDIVTAGVITSGVNSWMNDNVEVQLEDADEEKMDQVFFRFAYDREPLNLGMMDSPPKKQPDGATYATELKTGGWIVEAAIPWSILMIDTIKFDGFPALDKIISISVNVADLDKPDATSWDDLSGHIQWPKGWSAANVTLVETVAVDNIIPSVVTGVNATKLNSVGVTLNWTAAAAGDALGYLITKNDAQIAYVSDPATISYEVKGLKPETEYTFKVYAVDAQGISDASSPVTVTTLITPTKKSINIDKYNGPKLNPFDDLDAWDAQVSNPVSNIVFGVNGGPSDLTASFKVMWTSSNLYIQTNVVDQELDNSKSGTAWWETDNVEYHFDMDKKRDGTSCEDADGAKYKQDNFQYRAIERKGELQTGSTPAPKWDGMQQATYDLYDAEGVNIIGYTIEVNFPWATINTTSGLTFIPANGAVFAFDMKVSDTDPVAGEDWCNASWSTYEFSGLNRNNKQYGLMTLQGATGIYNQKVNSLNIYPNPASEFVQISMQNEVTGTATIIDMAGKQVASSSINNSRNFTLDTRSINKGIYFVVVTENNLVHRAKLVIE